MFAAILWGWVQGVPVSLASASVFATQHPGTGETASHSAKPPKSGGQAAGYSHSARLSKNDNLVAGYSGNKALVRIKHFQVSGITLFCSRYSGL